MMSHDIDDNIEKTCVFHQNANLKIVFFHSIKTSLLLIVNSRLIYTIDIDSLIDCKKWIRVLSKQ